MSITKLKNLYNNQNKTETMRALKIFYEQRLISHNIKPYKVVKLKTGIHTSNQNMNVMNVVQIWKKINNTVAANVLKAV